MSEDLMPEEQGPLTMSEARGTSDYGNQLSIMSLKRLQEKVSQVERQANIFSATQPPEEQPKPFPRPPNPVSEFLGSLVPGVSPNTIYLFIAALAAISFMRR